MSRTFTKLFSSITESTVWCEPDRTRLAWITMLAMADRNGRVWASVPGLANRARIPVDDARSAIETFLSPDPDSRTPDFEGRRIEPIDGGWRLLNHEKYRAIRDEETTKEAKRNYINARRAKERVENVERCRSESNTVDQSRDNAEADTEAEEIETTSLVGSDDPPLPKKYRIPCPADKLVEAFHAECPALPRVIVLSSKRKDKLVARWREVDADSKFTSADDGIELFRTMFRRVQASDFLSGRSGNWCASFDWIINSEANVLKIFEGNYDNGRMKR